MKPFNISLALLLSILAINFSFAQNSVKKETIKVWGNCSSCKKHIEKAAITAGATTASWNIDSKQLSVSYDPAKTSSITIQQAIAKAGYDTQDLSGDNTAYKRLDACCQYDRKKAGKKEQ
jgi:mercuric ion binding protein